MASAKKKTLAATFFLLMATTLLGVTLAGGGDVHTVGDSAGWTTFIDYNNWASSRNFHVGDIIVFNYNNQSHNVKQVTLQDFQSCNAESPVATFTTGSDSFSLKRAVHYYFLCGYPGHCEAGQKVDITVTPTSLRPIIVSPISAPSATPLPSSSSSPSSSPSNPDESNAASFKILLFKLWSPMLFFLVLFLHS